MRLIVKLLLNFTDTKVHKNRDSRVRKSEKIVNRPAQEAENHHLTFARAIFFKPPKNQNRNLVFYPLNYRGNYLKIIYLANF